MHRRMSTQYSLDGTMVGMNGDFLEPDFLMIPFQLVKDKELEQVDRLLYGIIYWFEHLRDGRCFAGNEKLASLLGTTTRVIQNSLTNLEKSGYIVREYKDAAKRNRTEIRSLIAFKLLSPTGDRRKTSDLQVTDVRPIGDRASDLQVTRERIGRKKNKIEREDTPAEIARSFFSEGEHRESILAEFTGKVPEEILNREVYKFDMYWTEPNKSGTKVRWEQEPTFDVRRRLITWFGRITQFQGRTINRGRGVEV